jgi:predicted restriction endonuclease
MKISKYQDAKFMRKYTMMRCAVCGRGHCHGHHLLEKSIYPERRYSEENMIPLCPIHHGEAHQNKPEFTEWLRENKPAQHEWVEDHRHHRKE